MSRQMSPSVRWNSKTAILMFIVPLVLVMGVALSFYILRGRSATPEQPVAEQVGQDPTALPPNVASLTYPVEGTNVNLILLPEKELRTLGERPFDPTPDPRPEQTEPEQIVIQETVVVVEQVVVTATPDPNVVSSPQPPVQPPDGTVSFVQHYIQPNDTLYNLTRIYNTNFALLAQYGITVQSMIAGETINVPVVGGGAVVPNVTCDANSRRHVVKLGENTFRLGIQYNSSADIIRQANGLDANYTIYEGQVLCIP